MANSSTWLITGTSAGLGLAIASHVLRSGNNVISMSRHSMPDESLKQLASSSAGGLYHINHDLSEKSHDAIKGKIAEFLLNHADMTVDVLVNNAGVAAFQPLENLSTDLLDQIMTTNFYSPFWLTQAILPSMRTTRNGLLKVIVNISSTQGLTCDAGEAAYDCSKHAFEAMSGVLAKEIHDFGIRTLIVNLGSLRTKFAARGKALTQASESTVTSNDQEDPYADVNHAFAQRLEMVMKYGDVADAARGDVYKAAQVIFDAVVQTPGSQANEALALQRRYIKDASAKSISKLERLVLGSDAQPKLERQAEWLNLQIESCRNVSQEANADDVTPMSR